MGFKGSILRNLIFFFFANLICFFFFLHFSPPPSPLWIHVDAYILSLSVLFFFCLQISPSPGSPCQLAYFSAWQYRSLSLASLILRVHPSLRSRDIRNWKRFWVSGLSFRDILTYFRQLLHLVKSQFLWSRLQRNKLNTSEPGIFVN